MENREKLIQLIKEQIDVERGFVKESFELEGKVVNIAAKLLILEMRLDSEKHAGVLNGILEYLRDSTTSRTIWDPLIDIVFDPFIMEKIIGEHVKIEDKMLSYVQEERKHTNDEGIQVLLQHIADDEKKHHALFESIYKNSYKFSS